MSSPPPAMPKKRKRLQLARLDDDLAFDADEDSIIQPESVSPAKAGKAKKSVQPVVLIPPHPRVSSDAASDAQSTIPSAKSKPPARRKRKDADDEDDWVGDVPEKPAKNRRKSRADEEDEEGGREGEGREEADCGHAEPRRACLWR